MAAGGYLDVSFGGAASLSVLSGGTVNVGTTGTFLSNGTTVTGGGIDVAMAAGAAGTITVSGAGALLTDKGGIAVGKAGDGVLDVLNGSTVSAAGGITAGNSLGAAGTILVSGAGAALFNTGTSNSITIGNAGTGALSVRSSGFVRSAGNVNIGGSAQGPAGHGSAAIATGGSLQAAASIYVWAGSTLSVDAAAAVDIGTGGTFVAGAILTESGHDLWGAGLVAASVVNNGSIAAANTNVGTVLPISSGVLEITGSISGTGSLAIASGATLQIDGAVGAGQTIFFGGPGATLTLGKPASLARPLVGLGAGDRIDLSGVTLTAAAIAGTALTLKQGTTSYVFTASASLANDRVQLKPDGGTGTVATLYAEAAPILSAARSTWGRPVSAAPWRPVRSICRTAPPPAPIRNPWSTPSASATVTNGSGTIASGGTARSASA